LSLIRCLFVVFSKVLNESSVLIESRNKMRVKPSFAREVLQPNACTQLLDTHIYIRIHIDVVCMRAKHAT